MKHVAEPLDYLYEELSPEAMAEARAHLAECPKCREETRKIRDLVKLYREGGGVRPPAGLAARAAAAALAARNGDVDEPSRPESGDTPDPDFERIKQTLCREIRPGWRGRLFHPAWTVAASVIFICAALIHFSPRNRVVVREVAPPPPATVRLADPARKQSRLPEVRPRQSEEAESAMAGPVPPLLREAEALGGTAPVSGSLAAGHAAAVPYAGSGVPPSEPVMIAPAPPPAAAPVQAPAAAPARARAVPAPVSPEALNRYAADLPPEALFMDMSPAKEPPQLIARPTPLDSRQSVRNLTVLAGMQIGDGEYDEARATIELLRRHDARQADAMADLLEKAEAAAVAGRGDREAEAEVPTGVAVPPDKYHVRSFGPTAVPESPSSELQSEPAATPEPTEPTEPSEPTEPTEPSEPPESSEVSPSVERLEIPDPSVVIVGEGLGEGFGLLPGGEVSVDSVPFASDPASGGVFVPADAPTVPKASPDAVPPTLWEWNMGQRDGSEHGRQVGPSRSRWDFFRRGVESPPADSLPAWRQTRRFTTDPYFRD